MRPDHLNPFISRRRFLELGSAALAALALGCSDDNPSEGVELGGGPVPFQAPVADPNGVVDLPPGFRYRIVSEAGARTARGDVVPGDGDGMAAFPGANGTTLLVRNHELRGGEPTEVPRHNPYRRDAVGGTMAIVVGPDRVNLDEFVTSSGTRNNCAGGATPWGTWLTCEESRAPRHGYVFEVDPRAPESDLSTRPITDMGFFSHEAVGIDPRTGVVYLTEDVLHGLARLPPEDAELVSFLFRYLPDNTSRRPGALQDGGRLQVMAIDETPQDTDDLPVRARIGIKWVDVEPEDPHVDALERGGTRFNRLEGAEFAEGALWFSDTMGGEHRNGQMFRYIPEAEALELWYTSEEAENINSPDNLTMSPWGDLWFAEDEVDPSSGDAINRVVGVTPDGSAYPFAINRVGDAEYAGPVFSPDGRTFFVNVHEAGLTLAIWGPFPKPSGARRRRMAFAPPPRGRGPRISEELHDASRRLGLSPLEAAAYSELGIPLG